MLAAPKAAIRWWRRLRVHVAAGTAAIVVLSVAATLVVASRLLAAHSVRVAAERMEASHVAFRHLVESRAEGARARVSLITVSPVFRAHLGDSRLRTDNPTMQAMADDYRRQVSADLLVVADARGLPIAVSGQMPPAAVAAAHKMSEAVINGRTSHDLRVFEDRAVLIVAEAARFADEVLGAVVAGYALDDAMARELAMVTHSDVNFVVRGRVVASSLAPDVRAAVGDRLASWTGRDAGRLSVSAGSSMPLDFVAAAFPLVPSTDLATGNRLVLLNEWAATEAALRELRTRFVWSGALILACALIGTAALSNRISRPLRDVSSAATDLAAGNWMREVPVRGTGEAAAMAAAFNAMSRHLRGSYERLEQHARALEAEILGHRRTENELVLARAVAEQANSAKSTFLANMSHELRTPLNAIIGYGELLLESAEERGDRTHAKDLLKIVTAGRHLVAVIKEILDFSKIEAGRMDVHVASFDLGALVESAVVTSTPLAAARGNRLVTRGTAGLGPLASDQTKVRQILLNLLSNACKFTASGSVTIDARRQLGDSGIEWVSVTVADTGIGMSAEQVGRLFREFSQADDSATREYGGTGLGLAISQRLSHLLGGDISVESHVGRGSAFTLRLPVDFPTPAPAAGSPRHGADQEVPAAVSAPSAAHAYRSSPPGRRTPP